MCKRASLNASWSRNGQNHDPLQFSSVIWLNPCYHIVICVYVLHSYKTCHFRLRLKTELTNFCILPNFTFLPEVGFCIYYCFGTSLRMISCYAVFFSPNIVSIEVIFGVHFPGSLAK